MFLDVQNIWKSYKDEPVLQGVQFALHEKKTLSILGRSGSGKTTLLKIIAGLEHADDGALFLNGDEITRQPPQHRGIVYLYQEALLFPHLNVFENIAFGLRIQHRPNEEITTRVTEIIDALELNGHIQKMPDQLSGGQKQRVAFGRAIIINPALLLLDEPFGSLDVEIRTGMQKLFKRIAHTYSITSIFVTHDLKEAILMGDGLAMMREGRLKSYQSTREFVHDPEVGVHDEITFWRNLEENNQ